MSRKPGPESHNPLSPLLPPRTPGSLGRNDAADPYARSLPGDTPGSLGVNDRAAQLAGGDGPPAVRLYRSMALAASPAPGGPGSTTSVGSQNFAAAQRTADYVQSVMDIGPSNRLAKAFWGFPAKYMCVHEMYDKVDQDLARLDSIYKQSGQKTGYKDQMEVQADWAKFYGCGNCGEYSSIAFTYLRDKEKMHPLDWMDYNDFKHAFVIVGRVSGSLPEKVNDTVDASCIKDWGDSAVLCDAYYGIAVAMPELISHFEGKKLHLLHRIE